MTSKAISAISVAAIIIVWLWLSGDRGAGYLLSQATDPTSEIRDCGPDWTVVASPDAGGISALGGIAAISGSDIWAVGYSQSGSIYQTLVEHWDGSAWSVVPSPNVGANGNQLNGVAAISSSDVWTVGYYDNGSILQTLVEHWDGTQWSVVPSPNLGTNGNQLNAVAALSASDIWAVGSSNSPVFHTLVEHWDGSAWSVVPSPNANTYNNLFGVTAISSSDVWAVGGDRQASAFQTLVEHWDGTQWSVVPSPGGATASLLNAASALSGSDIWAVGFSRNGPISTLVERWDGNQWTTVPSPNAGSADNQLNGVAAISSSDVWTVGYYSNGSDQQTLVEHWDGTQWNIMPSPNLPMYDKLNGVVATSSSDTWAVGFSLISPIFQTLVERYNPCTGSPTPALTGTPTIVPPTDTSTLPPTSTLTPATTATGVPSTPGSTASPALSITPLAATATETAPATGTPTRTPIPTSTSTPTACTVQFRDLPPGSTYYDYVLCLACRGIVSGYADGTFRPNNLTTRGQVCKIDILASGITSPVPQDRQTFEDIPPGSTFWLYIERAYAAGLVSGYHCGASPAEPCDSMSRPYFRPNGPASRGQIAKIIDRTAGFHEPPAGQTFEDVPPGSTFYTDVQRLAVRNIISGYACGNPEPCVPPANKPYFRPNGYATRGQLAKILVRAIDTDCVTP